MTTMKAVRLHAYGPPNVLVYEEVPRPIAVSGELLIQVHGAGVNPGECKIRRGDFAQYHTLPLTLGWELSGTVAEVGEGVTSFRLGDAVYAHPSSQRKGAYAEYLTIKATDAARKPTSLDFIRAASVPMTGLTAWQALRTAQLSSGQRILIHGAAGNVGRFAVQFAKLRGAYITATASVSDRAYVTSLGADQVIDYTSQQFEDVAHGMDVVLDTQGGETQTRSFRVLRPGGLLLSTVSCPPAQVADHWGVRAQLFAVAGSGRDLAVIGRLFDEGRIQTLVGPVLPLPQASEAQYLVEAGDTHGKVVLQVGTPHPFDQS